ncbi:MAG: alkaline phosphatase family protein [Planctomycetota bacterium]|nr:alkaline phosphatase family protein [Planctomycetota bacterium]
MKKYAIAMMLVFGGLVLGLAQPALAADPQYVISISVDGLGSSYLQSLLATPSQVPNFNKLWTQGAYTFNARDDYNYTETLQNHVTMVTARGVYGGSNSAADKVASTTTGHFWTVNGESGGTTIHQNRANRYVASVFDVAHDNGLKTGMYATKAKFNLIDYSYNLTSGAADVTGPDNGKDKIDSAVVMDYNSPGMMAAYRPVMQSLNPFNYSFVHFADPDQYGHSGGWGSTAYNNAVKTVDTYLGQIFSDIAANPKLTGNTVVILTADHGGTGGGHGTASDPLNYTIPFFVWGPGVSAGAELYGLNPTTRLDPVTGRPLYSVVPQPIRNADGANLALDLLGLGWIPGSTVNSLQDLAVPEPATLSLLALGGLALIRRRRSA